MIDETPRTLQAWRTVLEALLVADPAAFEPEELRGLARWLGERADERERTDAPELELPPPEQQAPPTPRVVRELRLGGSVARISVPLGEEPRIELARGPLEARTSAELAREPSLSPPTPATPVPARTTPHRTQRDWTRDLQATLASLELKLSACNLALGKHTDPPASGYAAQRESLLRAARELEDCTLWPLEPGLLAFEDWQLDLCAHCYENLATATRCVLLDRSWASGEVPPPEDLLFAIAEAQSALRAALREVEVHEDPDQNTVFFWLRSQAEEHRIFISRYMRMDDPADPGNWGEIADLFEVWLQRVRRRVEEERSNRDDRNLINKLRYELGKLHAAGSDDERGDRWTTILRVLDQWVEGGRPPSRREVCEPLEDLADEIPPEFELTKNAQLVLRAVDERIAQREQAARDGPEREREPGPNVLEARRLLAGRTLVLIGGERRPREEQRLCRDLGLAELRWIPTRAHRSLTPLIEEATKAEVDLVVVMARFSDHAFKDLRGPTEDAGKIFVHARAGYGSERLAHEILQQASGKLGGAAPR